MYFDGTEFTQPQVWAWVSDKVNCTTATAWPGDNMVKKDGMWYWEVPAGKQVPLEIIIHEGDNKIGGDDLPYKDKFIYHQDGSYSDPALPIITASPASGNIFKDEVAVTLSATLDATIYYTTDGSTPTTSSSVYTEALIFTETTTLKVLAVSGDKQTAQTYTYNKMPEPGEVVPGQNLTTKYYTINPNGQKGTRKTIDMQFDATLPYRIKATKALTNWDASDVVAQGVARDVCQAIYGQSNFEYNPAVLKGESGFTNVKSQTQDADHTFYEWIFPLSELGITADYIEEFGIGIMFVDIPKIRNYHPIHD